MLLVAWIQLKHTLAFLRLLVPLPTARPAWTGVEPGGHFYRKQSPRVGWKARKALTQSEPQEARLAGSQASAGQGGAGPRWGRPAGRSWTLTHPQSSSPGRWCVQRRSQRPLRTWSKLSFFSPEKERTPYHLHCCKRIRALQV